MHNNKWSLFESSSRQTPATLPDDSYPEDLPNDASQYRLLQQAGSGVSAYVWKALCIPLNQIFAIKVLDLENVNCKLDEIVRETTTMKNFHHPNVLNLLTSFVTGRELWMVMPYMSGGSILNIIKYEFPNGLPEPEIAFIMREVLKGLDYLHKNNTIHRDVKAGNILVGEDGRVLLGDFGVVGQMERGDSRKTFVGTPCWMAPEVMEQTEGYNTSADIWSFGITMLELAHGHAPFAKYPPMKVLLMTLQNPPPTLEESSNRHFSKSMKEVVQKCLNKDAHKRPSAAHLLEMRFFKQAAKSDTLAELVQKLPDLTERVRQLSEGKVPHHQGSQQRMHKSNEEYRKGVSSWNFDVSALKEQAANEPNHSPPFQTMASAFGGAALGAALSREITEPIPEEEVQLQEQHVSAIAGASAMAVIAGAGPAAAGAVSAATLAASPVPTPFLDTHHNAKHQHAKQLGRFTVLDNVENSPADTRGALLLQERMGSAPLQINEYISPTNNGPNNSNQVQSKSARDVIDSQNSHQEQNSNQKTPSKSRFKVVQQQSDPKGEQFEADLEKKGQQKGHQQKINDQNAQLHAQNAQNQFFFDKLIQQAIPRLQEIQEAQRTLADAHNSLLAAINEAQKGKKEMLTKYVNHPYVKVISGKQLIEFEQIKDQKHKCSQIQEENQELHKQNDFLLQQLQQLQSLLKKEAQQQMNCGGDVKGGEGVGDNGIFSNGTHVQNSILEQKTNNNYNNNNLNNGR